MNDDIGVDFDLEPLQAHHVGFKPSDFLYARRLGAGETVDSLEKVRAGISAIQREKTTAKAARQADPHPNKYVVTFGQTEVVLTLGQKIPGREERAVAVAAMLEPSVDIEDLLERELRGEAEKVFGTSKLAFLIHPKAQQSPPHVKEGEPVPERPGRQVFISTSRPLERGVLITGQTGVAAGP